MVKVHTDSITLVILKMPDQLNDHTYLVTFLPAQSAERHAPNENEGRNGVLRRFQQLW